MQLTPLFDAAPHVGIGSHRGRLQALVERQDNKQRVRPVGDEQQGSGEPAPVLQVVPGEQAKNKAHCGKGGLHQGAALIADLPLPQQCTIGERQTRGLLGYSDVEGGASKKSRNHQRPSSRH